MKTQPSVLVIDDEQIICDSCQRILTNEDYKVDYDTNAIGGYEKALINNYDLILLDLNMRDLDGMQLLTKLRKDKPDVPVIIITGYPTKETKEESKTLGVRNYILKPFKPSEILDPVKSILKQGLSTPKKEVEKTDTKSKLSGWLSFEKHYMFYKNGWVQKGTEEMVRVGGQFPVFMNEPVQSIQFAKVNEHIYRGFPIAEIHFANDIKVIIPSAVSGKVVEINSDLIKNPRMFEDDENSDNWVATVMPDKLEEDLMMCEARPVVYFSADEKSPSDYFNKLTNLGYIVNKKTSVDDVIASVASMQEKVVVMDAKSFSFQGPQFAEAIKVKVPEAKIIVFNVTDTKLETLYREKKIFYYAVDPVSRREMSSILYGSYCFTKDREVTESNKTSFLPPTVNRIQITNKHSKKVSLLAYDNVLQFNKGIGYLLIQKLHDDLFPIEIDHTRVVNKMRDASSSQKISQEKLKSDKVIVIYKDDMNTIPGSIVKQTETYENSNGSDNVLVKIAVQPVRMDTEELSLDNGTIKALTEMIELEMTAE